MGTVSTAKVILPNFPLQRGSPPQFRKLTPGREVQLVLLVYTVGASSSGTAGMTTVTVPDARQPRVCVTFATAGYGQWPLPPVSHAQSLCKVWRNKKW